ncbi:MAG: SDR family oxidoreductase [Fibrobacteres bacterium]|nr:SDR family oxidoreductase [Fibrobacterota bacterium]
MKKTHKTVLVTGAARRIGRTVSIACAEAGYGVIAHYNKSAREIAALGKEIRDLGLPFYAVKHDLSVNTSGLLARCLKLNDNIAGIINNASVFEKCALTDSVSDCRRILQINAFSPLALIRDFANHCKKGFVINLLDANIDAPHKEFQVYRLSKRMLREITMETAFSLAPAIRVNGISPGAVLPSQFSVKDGKPLPPDAPMVNGGTLQEISNAVKYLLENSNVTGQILYVDGGMHLRTGRV